MFVELEEVVQQQEERKRCSAAELPISSVTAVLMPQFTLSVPTPLYVMRHVL